VQCLTPLEADIQTLLGQLDTSISCVVIQTPDFFGNIHDIKALAEACHSAGILLIAVVTEVVSLGLITPPGHMGADIVVAEGQSLGNGANFGGPTVGLFSCRKEYIRQLPGRIVGQTVDVEGKRGFVLTLSTREQHIRREKATSNICTNSGLCALAFTIHASLLGATGLKNLASINHARAVELYEKLKTIKDVQILNKTFFNEFTLEITKDAKEVIETLLKHNIMGGIPISRFYPAYPNHMIVTATEMNTTEQINLFAQKLEEALA
jgi:glycine dehydrogenase subunit 1